MTETRTERLNVFARDLRRGDRIRNLTAAGVTAFDLDVDQVVDTVAIFPAQADLDAGADRRFDVAGGELLIVDREVEIDGTPVHAAVVAPVPLGAAPIRPTHADKVEPIAGVDPRLTIRRHLECYAYPANGNVHNPTPRYVWHLLVDGILVDHGARRGELVEAARTDGAAYLAEIDARGR